MMLIHDISIQSQQGTNLKPIIFSSTSVRAIIARYKTQTRRVSQNVTPPFQVGDILYVKEAIQRVDDIGIVYKADFDEGITHSWMPSRFMPKEAARLFIQITDIHAERLQDITREDVHAEGFDSLEALKLEWNRLNGNRSYAWDSNPWVWVINFKAIDSKGGKWELQQ